MKDSSNEPRAYNRLNTIYTDRMKGSNTHICLLNIADENVYIHIGKWSAPALICMFKGLRV